MSPKGSFNGYYVSICGRKKPKDTICSVEDVCLQPFMILHKYFFLDFKEFFQGFTDMSYVNESKVRCNKSLCPYTRKSAGII